MTTELKLDQGSDLVVTQGGIRVAFNAGGITVTVRGATITVDQKNGAVAMQTASNDSSGAATPKAHEVGEHLKDGTVCIAVDLEKNEALFAPEGIFGGDARFDEQDEVVEKVNGQKLHGHDDWRRTTDAEGKTLSEVWNKVAPRALQGSAAPRFWLAKPRYTNYGRVRMSGEAYWLSGFRYSSLPVPVVRSGPARS